MGKSDAWRRSSVRVAKAVGSLAQVLGPTQVEDAVAGADRDRIEETGGLFFWLAGTNRPGRRSVLAAMSTKSGKRDARSMDRRRAAMTVS
jgi:hypothetical protein